MMRWVSDLMWTICRALAWALQLAGVLGILTAAALGLRALVRRIESL